jgi:hypothetical protein
MVNQSPSDTHDSATCHLGVNRQPCEMCAWVNGTGPMPPAVERLAVEIQVGIDVDRAIDATNTTVHAYGDSLPPDFEEAWHEAPRSVKHGCEMDSAEYFFLKGRQAEQWAAVMVRSRLLKGEVGR